MKMWIKHTLMGCHFGQLWRAVCLTVRWSRVREDLRQLTPLSLWPFHIPKSLSATRQHTSPPAAFSGDVLPITCHNNKEHKWHPTLTRHHRLSVREDVLWMCQRCCWWNLNAGWVFREVWWKKEGMSRQTAGVWTRQCYFPACEIQINICNF